MRRQGGSSELLDSYFEHRAELLGYFTLRLRSADAAEDLVQDIYVRLAEVRTTEVRSPLAYLYRLGSNLMLDHLRSGRRAAARESAWRQTNTTTMRNDDIADTPDPTDALAARQRLSAIIEALKALGPQTQRVFRMHKLEGKSHSEVAAALGISRSAVEKHMIAALKHVARTVQ
jgi:RNA polymerase sigma-70 factor (ECF subfamily)